LVGNDEAEPVEIRARLPEFRIRALGLALSSENMH